MRLIVNKLENTCMYTLNSGDLPYLSFYKIAKQKKAQNARQKGRLKVCG